MGINFLIKYLQIMLSSRDYQKKVGVLFILFVLFFLVFPTSIFAVAIQQQKDFNEYEGVVIDATTREPLVFAVLSIVKTNITTITNTEGNFTLKVPKDIKSDKIEITMLGYKSKFVSLSQLKSTKNKILLDVAVIKLSEIVLNLPKDAKQLVKSMFSNTDNNYSNEHVLMTAFYRETIKKRSRNVSLAEAIVTIYKQPYSSNSKDKINLYKARKSTDYTKLDTIALKLEGGPFNALFVDVMKYPEYLFTSESIDLYKFSFSNTTTVSNRTVYVVDFIQNADIKRPLFFGKLYIDVHSKALVSAIYSLNVSNKERAARLFVKKKPRDVFVYPTSVSYRVDYRQKNGKWYYGYSNAQLTFKIKRKGKWFKSTYSINSEMLITDWKINTTKEKPKYKDRMRYSIIISDEASGFSDPEYWGEFNVIEPDKSIENAIKKIKKKLIE